MTEIPDDEIPRPGRMFLSIVVPCYNEEEGLREFHRRMTVAARALCGLKFELILIDDGSRTEAAKKEPRPVRGGHGDARLGARGRHPALRDHDRG